MFKIFLAVFLFFLTLIPSVVSANEKIETATMFFNNDSSEAYHLDVDRNVLELARNDFSKEISLSIGRSLNYFSYIYRPEAASRFVSLNSLFYQDYFSADAKIKGSLQKFQSQFFESDSKALLKFLKLSFKNPQSIKILFLYGHGVGALGFKDITTSQIKEQILTWSEETGMKLDLLVLDSCFLGNIDFLYEMRNVSRFTLASPEAEFSSGQPFDMIDSFLEVDNKHSSLNREERVRKIAEEILNKFLASYSTVFKGRERRNVDSSSAIFSLIDNKNLSKVVLSLKKIRVFLDQFSQKERELFNKKIVKFQMENPDLIDFGGMLVVLSEMGLVDLSNEIIKTKKLFDLSSSDFTSVSPHVTLKSPAENAILKIGVNDWSAQEIGTLEAALVGKRYQRFETYFLVSVDKSFRIYPFLPHILEFNAQWVEAKSHKALGAEIKVVRTSDLKIHRNKSSGPVLLFGFTESKRAYQKIYSGLGISHPFRPMPGFDYFDLEFQQTTNWLK